MDKNSDPQNQNYSFLVYEKKKFPKYFQIPKKRFYLLFVGLPIFSLVVLLAFGASLVYIKKISSQKVITRTQQVVQSTKESPPQDDLTELRRSEQDYKNLSEELQKKLTSASCTPSAIPFVAPVPGQQDLTDPPLVSTSDLSISNSSDKVQVKFNFVNLTKENNKISGHCFVILKNWNSVIFYPQDSFPKNETLPLFADGEAMTFARLRPVEASFPLTEKNGQTYITILFFSRTGDLLYKKTTPFNLEK